MRFALTALLACGCSCGEETTNVSSDAGGDADSGNCALAEPTTYLYDPFAELTTFPDDLHTVDEPATQTGLAVRFADETRAQFEKTLPEGYTLISALEALDGFGTSAGITVQFTAPVDPATFTRGNVRILEIESGTDVGWDVEWQDAGASAILFPLFPLAESSRYGLVVTTGVLDCAGQPVGPSPTLSGLLAGTSEDPRLARLHDRYVQLLASAEEPADRIAAAVVWTTQTLFAQDEAVALQLAAETPVLVPAAPCGEIDRGVVECTATLTARDFLGDDEVMEVAFGEDPAPQRTYDLAVSIWLPGDGTGGPFPTAIYGHGLGGDRGGGGGYARDLADLGMAVVSIDSPKHGAHPTSSGEGLFEIFEFLGVDPIAQTFDALKLRDHFRAATFDKLQLARAIRAGVDLTGDGENDLDGSRLVYGGHSLGGLMGPGLLALDPDVLAGDLSVPGGRVADIIRVGETFFLLVEAMRPREVTDGQVERFFPLLQTAIERGDPINWSTRVLDGRRDLLVAQVIDDSIIPNLTTRAIARALGVEHVPPFHQDVEGLERTSALPISGNVDGRTAVLYQFAEQLDDDGVTLVPAEHTDIHSNPLGVTQVHHFWESWLADGVAEVIDPFDAMGI